MGIWRIANGLVFSGLTNPTYQKGLLFYDETTESMAYYDDIAGTTVNLAQEQFIRARNDSGVTILNGSVVYITGATGQNPTIGLARANSLSTSEIIGVATHDILNNTVGKITTFGLVNDLDTSSYTDGQVLYLSSSTPGQLSTTVPISPNYTVYVCSVLHSHINKGKILVRPEKPIALNTALLDDNKSSPSVTAVKTYIDNGLSSKRNNSTQTSGVSISFNIERIYNLPSAPATGAITNDLTGAKIGIVQKIYHNNSSSPSFPGGWVNIGGTYTNSVLNIIYAEWIEGSRVEYWIIKG